MANILSTTALGATLCHMAQGIKKAFRAGNIASFRNTMMALQSDLMPVRAMNPTPANVNEAP